ncbi:class I SAM-dependent methyltransferase [Flavobacterium sp. UMI-01]|uniref:class I SAM-dependent methyltransferase n=1 Tax=Flavobacterium sp. UMI-01 TaxID=1441053 RepID=UPI001C7D85E8|nr:class I SAM-dependent methyltransferase [Flavobacterium sp. UMI-01]GIZ07999.1 carboxy-S-adenosyl-L-methionine synthase [Flavobacterium sp. UMI-01]
MKKSTVTEIQQRFDNEVERFSNLDTGQVATMDAVVSLELITATAKMVTPKAKNILDLGCGAGNYTLKMLSKVPDLNCTLIDLSQKMLDKAQQRVACVTKGTVETIQGDIREITLPNNQYDIILAGAVLHHLREETEWEMVFQKLYDSLTVGGCFFISDLITQDHQGVNQLIWENYSDYLRQQGGKEYQQKVFAYIEKEDTPRSMTYQLDLMKKVGFASVEILHKNACFGAFGGIK